MYKKKFPKQKLVKNMRDKLFEQIYKLVQEAEAELQLINKK